MAEHLSSVRDGAVLPYAAQAVLDARTLAALTEANDSFLALIAGAAAEPGVPAQLGIPAATAARVAELAAPERARIASCPYTLFDLRFGDAAFWSAPLPPRPAAPASPAGLAFARTSIFLAWHLAHSNALAAALVLGMSADVQRAWRALPLSELDAASHVVLPHLRARFGSHPSFWARLLAGTPAASDSARLLGLQLLAAAGDWPGARAAGSATA